MEQPWTSRPDELFARLGSGPDGLTEVQAAERLRVVGENRLPEAKKRGPLAVFAAQFKSFLNLLLVAAAGVALAVGDRRDALVIAVVVVFNAVLGFAQEYRAERAVAALKGMLARTSRVRRDGEVQPVPAETLVPGDVVLVEAGDRIPADGRVFVAVGLEIDESALTGESVPVAKTTDILDEPEAPVGDRINMAYMNTVVTRGRGELLVTVTGAGTEMGRVAGLLQETEQAPTPLQRQVDALGKRLALIAGVVVVIICVIDLLRGHPLAALLMEAVAIAVAAIPEGLPAVVTVTLAIGMARMARQRAIVKRMPSVETLGSTTDICSDKTGTLTLNQMTARRVVLGGGTLRVSGEGYRPEGRIEGEVEELHELLRAAALCNDSSVRDGKAVGDPTEAALVTLAAKGGIDVERLRREEARVAEVPFDAARKFMATVHRDGSMLVKGAPDVLLERCVSMRVGGLEVPIDRARVLAENEALAREGLRVLALAERRVELEALPRDPDELVKHVDGLVLLGLVGLLDPPRTEALEAIRLCKEAGIAVRMITGDHVLTATAIARRLGLSGEAVSGAELDRMDDEELARRVFEVDVFARVAPEHKIRIVRALRSRGRVVAMLGDGVNDAPALKGADIGVAMGITGTEVTKEAASLILTDDNFATVVGAVREGRTIYDNIVKFLRFQLSTNLGALATIFFAPFLGLPDPFNPLQILWVNLIMDGPPAMALGVEPGNPAIMQQPPRDPRARLLDGRRLLNLSFLGAIMAAGTLGVMELGNGQSAREASTLAFTTFVFFQVFNVFNARAEGRSAFGPGFFANWRLWGALAGVVVLQIAAVHVGFLRSLLRTEELEAHDWALAVGVAASVLVLEELRKLVFRKRAVGVRRAEMPYAR